MTWQIRTFQGSEKLWNKNVIIYLVKGPTYKPINQHKPIKTIPKYKNL